MGLDVTAYSNLKYIGHHKLDDPDDGDRWCSGRWKRDVGRTHVPMYSYSVFTHALMGLPDQRLDGSFSLAGCYELTPDTETHSLYNSYGGYNRWRGELADQFNPYRGNGNEPPSPEGPFFELIWFADNEGTLNTPACASLLRDFMVHRDAYVAAHGDEDGRYEVRYYDEWLRACEVAAHGGVIDFH